ncbi:MAG: methylmalonyl-CoA mutase small subunit [Cyclobacteriaceae bacterium]|nr:methylmalonyl-CoA mutase small subunit [Cyclobacteriaceae bacterium]
MKEVKSSESLFTEFPKVSKDQWKEKAIADLKGADFDKKLIWRTLEGFDLQPYYASEDMTALSYLQKFESSTLNMEDGSQGPHYWVNREKIVVTDAEQANKAAIHALNSGADGLVFDLTGKENIDIKKLLNNILPLHCSVSFIADRDAAKLIKGYFTYESGNHIETSELFGSINYDPIKNLCLQGKMAADGFVVLKEIIEITDTAARFRGLTINSTQFQNSGSSLTQELAFALNVAVEYIDKLGELGISPEQAIRNLEFCMAVGTDYFLEIAKLRALRILFYKVAEAYGLKDFDPGDLQIHSTSSMWTKTVYDPYVNMLRNTTEAMSAVIGGCNALTIAPYDENFAIPSAQSKRISRNVSNMLKEESYFDRVVDPAAGSYYIENITNEMVKKSWALFTEVEQEGGFLASFKAGKIQSRIKETRDKRLALAAQRREIFVGTNQYPNTKEQLDPKKISHGKPVEAEIEVLKPENGAIQFESMRLATDGYAKTSARRPKAYLALIGNNPTMRTARAQFSGGFIGCGGFEIADGIITNSNDEAIKTALEQNAEITVICGSDDDYATLGIEFAQKFRNSKKDGILVVAGYPTELLETLNEAGVDEFVHMRADLIQTLQGFQQKLNIINQKIDETRFF